MPVELVAVEALRMQMGAQHAWQAVVGPATHLMLTPPHMGGPQLVRPFGEPACGVGLSRSGRTFEDDTPHTRWTAMQGDDGLP